MRVSTLLGRFLTQVDQLPQSFAARIKNSADKEITEAKLFQEENHIVYFASSIFYPKMTFWKQNKPMCIKKEYESSAQRKTN